MPKDLLQELQRTLDGLSRGLSVRDIASFPVLRAQPSQKVEALRAEHENRFDQFAVERGYEVIGTLEIPPQSVGDARVEELMRPLADQVLVGEHTPLLDFLDSLSPTRPYRFVLRGSRVAGIVTRSDLLKLPVRTLAFSVITCLERIMSGVIRLKFPDSADWLSKLSDKRRAGIFEKREKLAARRLDPDLLELTDLCDKRGLCLQVIASQGRKEFERDLRSVENLRNDIAHAGTFVAVDEDLENFVLVLRKAQFWAHVLVELSGSDSAVVVGPAP